jgi:Leucine-rich repeat (LRR) protein
MIYILIFVIVVFGFTTNNGFEINPDIINFNDKDIDYNLANLNSNKEYLNGHDKSLLSLTSTSSSCNVTQYEYDALKSLYQSTNGDEWVYTDSNAIQWNFSNNLNEPCATNSTWYGLTCTSISNDICSITQIALINTNLNGILPDNLDNFGNLTALSLNNNQLSSSIPSSISNLVKLTYLALNNNKLNNTIPSSINNLVILDRLFLYSNSLSGVIPDISNLEQLIYLVLYNNKISGPIPTSVYSLTNLAVIDLHNNQLNGVISPSISNLFNLVILFLSFNSFEDSIPNTICINTNLQSLILNNNLLKNGIPSNIGSLTRLSVLYLSDNELTSTIPESMYFLTNLVSLEIASNKIQGTISPSIGNLVYLTSLHYEVNMISGSVPSTIQFLTQLQTLNMYNNKLENSIPTTIGNLGNLNQLILYSNNLKGLLPTSICSLTSLTMILLYSNELSGSICSNIGDLNNLISFDLHNNSIGGSIPSSVGELNNLNAFTLYNNILTGSIPGEMGYLTRLTSLLLQNNNLIGTVNVFLMNLVNLRQLSVNNNMLTGTIDFLKTYQQMQILDISYNKFTGNLLNIESFTNLNIFFCSDNLLTGNLDNIISSTNNENLINIDFSNNYFTGTLPMDFFNIKSLKTFAAGSNCIATTLSSSICNSTSLISLILNGLITAIPCRTQVFPLISSSTTYYADNKGITADDNGIIIPDCLFNMEQLTTLQLSGNIIKGSISDNLVINSKLKDLAMSNNQFQGSIPKEILGRKWHYLNLGHNKLGGVLITDMPSVSYNASLTLDNNRLSGSIPQSLFPAKNISVLSGNIFTCPIINSISELPKNDKPFVNLYKCGSDSLFTTFIISIVFICIFILLKTDIVKSYTEYEVVEINNSLQGFFVYTLPDLWSKYVKILQSLSIDEVKISSLSKEKLENGENNNFQFKYFALIFDFSKRVFSLLKYFVYLLLLFWIPTSFILKNNYGTYTYSYGFIISLLHISGETPAIIMIILFFFSMIIFYIILNWNFPVIEKEKDGKNSIDSNLKISVMFLVLIINCICILSLNTFYIYATINFSPSLLNIIQVLVAGIKIVWKYAVLPSVIHAVSNNLINDYIHDYDSSELIIFQSFVEVLNILVIPCIATSIFNPNCFYYSFVSQTPIVSSYTYLAPCVADSNDNYEACLQNGGIVETRYTSFDAPFLYSYECSSTLVTNYANVYIFMAFMLVFQSSNFGPILINRIKVKLGIEIPPELQIFKRDRFIINIVSFLLIAVTVGVVMPILGIFICLCIYLFIHLTLTHCGIKYTKLTDEDSKLKFMKMIEIDCKGVLDSVNYSLRLFCLPLMGLFYSLFVFDTLGDAIGSAKSLWTLFVMTLFPYVLFSYSYYNRVEQENMEEIKLKKKELTQDDIEMSDNISTNPMQS